MPMSLDVPRARPLRFLRLAHQCPFAARFASEAGALASQLGLDYMEVDVTGRPDLACGPGACFGAQVDVPGYPLLVAPRSAAQMLSDLEGDWPDARRADPARRPAVCRPDVLTLARPGQPGWGDAVAGTVRVCVPDRVRGVDREEAAAAKRQWLEEVDRRYGPGAALATAFVGGRPVGFAELLPAGAACVPLPAVEHGDVFVTCLHADAEAGDTRPSILEFLGHESDAAPDDGGFRRMWAVSGVRRSYPNGPLALFEEAGFTAAAGLGRLWLPGHGWDDLVLVSRGRSGGRPPEAVGLALAPSDNVATLPGGCGAGETVRISWPGADGVPETVRALEGIPAGHKMALAPLPAGRDVVKYGERIGEATQDIDAGQWVHVHNVRSARAGGGGRE